MLQDLEFNEYVWRSQNREFCDSDDDDDQIQRSFANMVDHVLLLHIGPIRKFQLFCDEADTRDIDRWLTHLSRNSIKELVLRLWVDEYKIPSCVFSCQELVHLELTKCFLMDSTLTECLLKPPSTFKGFRSLKSLQLVGVNMAQDVYENLIGCSPLLERLTLRHCDRVTDLKIDAPNLKYIDIFGIFDVVSLENTLNITDASIGVTIFTESVNQRWVPESWVPSSSSNLLKILDHLPHIRRLEIKSHFLKATHLLANFINFFY